jgi:carbon storage regulator
VLVVTRKDQQSIMIGDEIEISVLGIEGDKVRIGIDAPRSIPVFRKEIYIEVKRGEGRGVAQAVEEALVHRKPA